MALGFAGFGASAFGDPGDPAAIGFATTLSTAGVVNAPTINLTANKSITGVAAGSAVGTLTLTAKASKTLTAVTTTSAVNSLTFAAKANHTPTAVTAGSAVGTLAPTADANNTLTAVTSTGAVNAPSLNVDANLTLTAVTGAASVNAVTGAINANIDVTGVAAGSAVNTFSSIDLTATLTPQYIIARTTAGLLDGKGKASVTSPSVTVEFTAVLQAGDGSGQQIGDALKIVPSAPMSIPAGTLGFDAEANHTITGQASAGVSNSTVDFDAEANITTAKVTAGSAAADISTFLKVLAAPILTPVFGTARVNLDAPANNLFDYDSIADLYSRQRTVYILDSGAGLSNTVHIHPVNYTLFLDPPIESSKTVAIS